MLSIATLFVVIFSAMALPRERGKINISNEFINSVRRQLTRDSYDYYEEDESKTNTPQMRANSKHEEPHYNNNTFTRDYQHKRVTRYNYYIPTLARHVEVKDGPFKNKQSQTVEHTVSHRDLLYYMDDRELVPEQKEQIQSIREHVKQKEPSATKYKILKLKHQYRRQNQPRLIQEESMGTVAIVNLDGGPIPEVRLPPSRRQYMLDRGEIVGEEDEIPPPVINSSDPDAAPEDAYTKSNSTIAPEIIK